MNEQGMGERGMHGRWHGMHPAAKGLRIAGMVVLGVIAAALFGLVFGWLVMILWNWLMPQIFHLGEVTYWQSFGIVILAKLLFGGIGGARGGHGRNPWRGNPWERGRRGPHGRDDWRWYREFWEQEGRPAFERFAERKRSESAAASGPEAQGS